MTDGSLTHVGCWVGGESARLFFGKTRQLCMYVATWCEYSSFSLQYTGQSPSIIQTTTLGSRECWAGEGPLAGVRRESSQLWCLHQRLLHHVMTHLSELNKQPRPHKLQVCPCGFASALVRNIKAVRSWREVEETVKVLYLYRSTAHRKLRECFDFTTVCNNAGAPEVTNVMGV